MILPFTLLRRLECVLEPTKDNVLAAAKAHRDKPDAVREQLLLRTADQPFFNASPLSLASLSDTQPAEDLMSYVEAFSTHAREIFDHFHFEDFVEQLAANNLLYQVVQLIDATERSAKMRKSLGSKRQYIDDANIEAIVRTYGSLEESDKSKFLSVAAFGYRRITVERPLRLNFQVSVERIQRMLVEKPIQKLGATTRLGVHAACERLDPDRVYTNREAFLKDLQAALKDLDVKLGTPALKAIWSALSERDPEAETCTDNKGVPEPDSELRDNENVPLGEDVFEYFEREVKPHVPDAWIDEGKRDAQDGEIGIVGFEIPFNRHFYVFQPPRSLEAIDADLKAVTTRIKQMIEELSA